MLLTSLSDILIFSFPGVPAEYTSDSYRVKNENDDAPLDPRIGGAFRDLTIDCKPVVPGTLWQPAKQHPGYSKYFFRSFMLWFFIR
jgi:hypothetical protein